MRALALLGLVVFGLFFLDRRLDGRARPGRSADLTMSFPPSANAERQPRDRASQTTAGGEAAPHAACHGGGAAYER